MSKRIKYYVIPVDKLLNDPSDYRIFDMNDATLVSLSDKELNDIQKQPAKNVYHEGDILIPIL